MGNKNNKSIKSQSQLKEVAKILSNKDSPIDANDDVTEVLEFIKDFVINESYEFHLPLRKIDEEKWNKRVPVPVIYGQILPLELLFQVLSFDNDLQFLEFVQDPLIEEEETHLKKAFSKLINLILNDKEDEVMKILTHPVNHASPVCMYGLVL